MVDDSAKVQAVKEGQRFAVPEFLTWIMLSSASFVITLDPRAPVPAVAAPVTREESPIR